ncbi:MAG TPA: T9SS type A sorting domain-containing protein, partial [Hymenobacter sp.]|nr:T9SS type A sorting domain-containing protein [Hymenobacter sp.]
QAIYEGTPANLTITFGGDGPWTLTYADSVRSYSVATAVSPFVAEVRPARTTTYRITTLSNSCGSGPSSGTATVSVLTLLSVDDNPLDPLVMAYPTPTPHTLTVELDLALTRDPAELSLINRRGQAVLQRTTRSRRTEIDLSTQPSGLYILRIQVGDRHTVRKVVKL